MAFSNRYNRNYDATTAGTAGDVPLERPRPKVALRLLALVTQNPTLAPLLQEAVMVYGYSTTGKSRLVMLANAAKDGFTDFTVEIPKELHDMCRNHKRITASAIEAIYAGDLC